MQQKPNNYSTGLILKCWSIEQSSDTARLVYEYCIAALYDMIFCTIIWEVVAPSYRDTICLLWTTSFTWHVSSAFIYIVRINCYANCAELSVAFSSSLRLQLSLRTVEFHAECVGVTRAMPNRWNRCGPQTS